MNFIPFMIWNDDSHPSEFVIWFGFSCLTPHYTIPRPKCMWFENGGVPKSLIGIQIAIDMAQSVCELVNCYDKSRKRHHQPAGLVIRRATRITTSKTGEKNKPKSKFTECKQRISKEKTKQNKPKTKKTSIFNTLPLAFLFLLKGYQRTALLRRRRAPYMCLLVKW